MVSKQLQCNFFIIFISLSAPLFAPHITDITDGEAKTSQHSCEDEGGSEIMTATPSETNPMVTIISFENMKTGETTYMTVPTNRSSFSPQNILFFIKKLFQQQSLPSAEVIIPNHIVSKGITAIESKNPSLQDASVELFLLQQKIQRQISLGVDPDDCDKMLAMNLIAQQVMKENRRFQQFQQTLQEEQYIDELLHNGTRSHINEEWTAIRKVNIVAAQGLRREIKDLKDQLVLKKESSDNGQDERNQKVETIKFRATLLNDPTVQKCIDPDIRQLVAAASQKLDKNP